MSTGVGRRAWLVGRLAGGLALAGCGLSERPYVERREWPLTVTRPGALPPRAGGLVVLVRAVRAAPGLEARGLRSLRADGSVAVDFYEEWEVTPADAVETQLRAWLSASGLFAAVLAPGSRLNADLIVEPSLDALIADVPAGVARVSLGIVALDQRLGRPKVMAEGSLKGAATLSGSGAPAIVAASRAALADVLTQAERTLSRLR